MDREKLIQTIRKVKSCLCVGLDTDPARIPEFLKTDNDPVFTFNKAIIDATKDHCIAYKINTAFYESMGYQGWISLEKTLNHIGNNHFLIADVKRSDIGNTANYYAKAYFKNFAFDAVTLSPYMGADSVLPFLEYSDKWVILLGLTSNEGANDFQLLPYDDGFLFEYVIKKSSHWGNPGNTMYVAGATRPELLSKVRKAVPEHFLLVPGIGAQGGDIKKTADAAMNHDGGMIINVSRSILYASNDQKFATLANEKAKEYHTITADLLSAHMAKT
jgi:orotidine-5'-phosphate decarboxylase